MLAFFSGMMGKRRCGSTFLQKGRLRRGFEPFNRLLNVSRLAKVLPGGGSSFAVYVCTGKPGQGKEARHKQSQGIGRLGYMYNILILKPNPGGQNGPLPAWEVWPHGFIRSYRPFFRLVYR
jgi:hypothetical protein